MYLKLERQIHFVQTTLREEACYCLPVQVWACMESFGLGHVLKSPQQTAISTAKMVCHIHPWLRASVELHLNTFVFAIRGISAHDMCYRACPTFGSTTLALQPGSIPAPSRAKTWRFRSFGPFRFESERTTWALGTSWDRHFVCGTMTVSRATSVCGRGYPKTCVISWFSLVQRKSMAS